MQRVATRSPRRALYLSRFLCLFWLVLFAYGPAARAHLVSAQRASVHVVGQGAYLVWSVPVSALKAAGGAADLSLDDLKGRAPEIEEEIARGIQLTDASGPLPLEGVMISLTRSSASWPVRGNQVVVVGRFALRNPAGPFRIATSLFGRGPGEDRFDLVFHRGDTRDLLVLSADHPSAELGESVWRRFLTYVMLGMEHILTGADHLLFLLVTLAAVPGRGRVVAVLSTFTLGHALTLAAGLGLGWLVSPALVEPAIAATIILTVILEPWLARRDRRALVAQLLFVLGCAMVHGLSFATALSDRALSGASLAIGVVGFNIGIELAQIGVALAAALAVRGLILIWGAPVVPRARRLARATGGILGTLWLLERIASA